MTMRNTLWCGLVILLKKREERTHSGKLSKCYFLHLGAEMNHSSFFMLLQGQKFLQNKKQDILPVSEAPVQAGAPV